MAEQKTLEERKAVLAEQVKKAVKRGGRIESQNDTMAVLVSGKRVNHILHFIVGLFTFGVWWIVWISLALTGGEKRRMISVDDYGETRVQRA